MKTLGGAFLTAVMLVATSLEPASPQSGPGTENGEWRYIGGDAGHTRYSPLDQINAQNFESLEVAWLWRGDNYAAYPEPTSRSTPVYADGVLYTVAGARRQVIAMDPATGETLWTFREPHTTRFERSMRASYGKGIAYAELDGRGVVYISTPGFFLWALDAKTGRPLEGWGRPIPLDGFPQTGGVDLVEDLIRDWGPWQRWQARGERFDHDFGLPRELGMITASSPPIVVNGVVIVGNSAEQGYNQTRIENVPGDILAYDARTGDFKWKFHVIPRPGEFGHETWENDAWEWTGDVSSWAPMSADPERGLVYIPTNPPTIDFYGGFRPGAGLFGTSVIALNVQTGERVWHYQTVHHDIWNLDNPTAPILMDVNVDGRERPIVVQATKQAFAYTFDRATGQPIWPIEERPVPQSTVPGERLAPTQPFPTRPAAYEQQGISESQVISLTPALRQEALDILRNYQIGPLFNAPIQVGHPSGLRSFLHCPSGATNINEPPSADPETGILYVPSAPACRSERLVPASQIDNPNDIMTTGTTLSDFAVIDRGDFRGPQGLSIYNPPWGKITAIDMNTGEHLFWFPTGDTPDRITNHPALRGVTLPESVGNGGAISMVTRSLLFYASEGSGGEPRLYAVDKRTGRRLGQVDLPAAGQYGMMTYMHEGRQHIVVQIGGNGIPGSLVALRLP
jgi:quinoprotein glucose dehydrogenase